ARWRRSGRRAKRRSPSWLIGSPDCGNRPTGPHWAAETSARNPPFGARRRGTPLGPDWAYSISRVARQKVRAPQCPILDTDDGIGVRGDASGGQQARGLQVVTRSSRAPTPSSLLLRDDRSASSAHAPPPWANNTRNPPAIAKSFSKCRS